MKSVIVTGSARGIGAAIAQRLVDDYWSVVLFDISPGVMDTAATIGSGAYPIIGDVRSIGDLEAAVLAAAACGPLRGLVNNAASLDFPRRNFEAIPDDEWDQVMDVNVKGVWKACRAAVPELRAAGGGSIVNISSDTVLTGVAGFAHYIASKGAVMSLSRALASELGPSGIRVNSVALGFTETPTALAHGGDAQGRSVARRPLGRAQTAHDAVGTVSWLLSADSDFVTGQLVTVNGGYAYH